MKYLAMLSDSEPVAPVAPGGRPSALAAGAATAVTEPAIGSAAIIGSGPTAGSGPVPTAGSDGRTRDRVAQLLLERGGATAAELSETLGLSPPGVRRHLDAMLADGDVVTRQRTVRGPRGRGRPAKVFLLTDAARLRCGQHTYDNFAAAAVRWIAATGGSEAVTAFAAEQVSGLEARCRIALEGAGDDPLARAEALARALTAEGYAANATAIATGGQLCQHHCPVAHVAAEFPQLCEAETAVISRLIGTHVQRLATIAHGDGVCTTHIPASGRVSRLGTPAVETPEVELPAVVTSPVGTPEFATSTEELLQNSTVRTDR